MINSLGAGGAEQSLAELLGPLERGGVEAVVACLGRRDVGPEARVLAQGFDVRFLRQRRMAPQVVELRRLIRDVRPELVHTAIFDADVVGRLAATGTGATVLTTLVNTAYDPARSDDPHVSSAKLRVVRALDAWTARHLTDHFHALTVAVKDSAVTQLGVAPERVTVVARGRDPERLGRPSPERKALARQRLGLAADDEIVLHVGRQEYQKDIPTLIEAVISLARRRPHLVLLQAGRAGHDTAIIEDLAGRLDGRVRVLGHRDDVAELLAAADLFAFPSRYEGLGGAVIEAMALGLAVVASDLPALREVVEPDGTGVLVAPAKPGLWATAIDELLSDHDRRRAYGRRARQVFEERFTLTQSVGAMLRLYQEVVTGTVRRHR
ncbi:N/A [soil metagenome]